MQEFGEMIQPFLTKEVVTVIGAMAVAWIGWKAACKGTQLAGSFASKASFAGLTAATMMFAGLGVTGLGIGELATRGGGSDEPIPVETQLTNNQLVALAQGDKANDIDTILRYAQERDTAARQFKGDRHVDADGNLWVLALNSKQVKDATNIEVSYENSGSVFDFEGLHRQKKPAEPAELPFEVSEVNQDAMKNEESMMSLPMAWSTVGLGLASIIASVCVFASRPQNVA